MFRSLRAVRQSASLVSCIFQEPSLPGMDWIISWGERTTPVGGDFSSGVAFFSAHFCCCLSHFIEQSEPGAYGRCSGTYAIQSSWLGHLLLGASSWVLCTTGSEGSRRLSCLFLSLSSPMVICIAWHIAF